MTTEHNNPARTDSSVSLGENELARTVLAQFGDVDFTAADFFEAYAQAIEKRAQEIERFQTVVTDTIRNELLILLDYFSAPDEDYRLWPQPGLRALAMLAPIHVASGVLGPSEALLQLAIRSQRPNKGWSWWRALGVAILTEQTDTIVMDEFGLTLRAVQKYRKFLIGRQRPLEQEVA